jgi:hypothetical protein
VTIAVIGATGTVGRHVVAALVRGGATTGVRGLTRRPDTAATRGPAAPAGVRWTSFSYADPATWPGAFRQVRALFVVRPPETVDVVRGLLPALDAARDLGVDRMVFLSVLGAQRNPLLPHRRVERWLETSGTAASSLRAGNFMQNSRGCTPPTSGTATSSSCPRAGPRCPTSTRATSPTPRPPACSAGRRSGERGTSPARPPSPTTRCRRAGRRLGRPIHYTRPSLLRYWVHAHRTGMDPGLIAATSALYTLARLGVGGRTSGDVATLLGRAPRDIATFAHDHRAVWQHG